MSVPGAKLVCTLGPATEAGDSVRALAEAGCDVFRVNFSHGDPKDHAKRVQVVRSVREELGSDLAVMADLPGPKIRLGDLTTEPLALSAGSRFVLRPGGRAGGAGGAWGASVTYEGLARDIRPGDRILLADGAVELIVRDVEGDEVVTEVVRAGSMRARAGVNVPAERLELPAITDRDREALAAALDLGVDLVAQSFVRSAADVAGLRALMGARALPIVAKIETQPAVEDIDKVLVEADAVMVARGDLGVELPMEEIPIVQKEILLAARGAARPTIVATQMLESMTHASRPTRAEATDVANAVLDGADAIMLSAETAIGEFPVEAASAAVRIAEVAEERGSRFRAGRPACTHADEGAAAAHAASQIAGDAPDVVAVSCFTRTGRTAAFLSSERPPVPIYAFAPDPAVRRALAIRWGVRPLPAAAPDDTDDMIALMDEGLRAAGAATDGQLVVLVAASPFGRAHTNMIKIHRLGSPVR
ncbi:MAG TPA: pyruvate kinase [Actinomycetota bacterium]|nr:pyruvate kinase [Actinomycetota bacterium]